MPSIHGFTPIPDQPDCSPVILTVDEYEAVRLIDKEGFSQEECSSYMAVARTTVQQIYASARHKLALALVDGLPLKIEGGDYRLCDGAEKACNCGGCRRHRIQNNIQEEQEMKIAVTYENGKFFSILDTRNRSSSIPCLIGRSPTLLLWTPTEAATARWLIS